MALDRLDNNMSMYPIATSGTLGSTQTEVQFLSILQDFTHLQLRCYFKSAYAGGVPGLYVHPLFNNVAGGNYRWHNLVGNGSTTYSSTGGSTVYTGINGPINSGTTNIFGVAIINILDYSNTNKYKTIRTIGGYDRNGAGEVGLGSLFRYDATTAINGFTISDLGGGGWLAGSRFDLYGISTSSATGA